MQSKGLSRVSSSTTIQKTSRCLLHLDTGNMKVNKTSPLPLVQPWGPNSSFWEKETARIPQTISLDHGLRWQRAGEDEELKNIKVSVVCSGADLGSLKTALNIHNNCHYNDNGYMCVLSSSHSLRPHGLQPTRLPCPWDSPGKEEWVAVSFHGIFSTQGSNLRFLQLLCWQADSLPLSHLGSLE